MVVGVVVMGGALSEGERGEESNGVVCTRECII